MEKDIAADKTHFTPLSQFRAGMLAAAGAPWVFIEEEIRAGKEEKSAPFLPCRFRLTWQSWMWVGPLSTPRSDLILSGKDVIRKEKLDAREKNKTRDQEHVTM